MLHNVEFTSKPKLYIYEHNKGMACITLADNIREGLNADDENCWYADLYMMEIPDSDNVTDRLDRNFQAFLAKAKELDEAQTRKSKEPSTDEIAEMAYVNSELALALIELI